ncbi:hydrolase [Bordetella sp. J329]|jgi:predicted amidohydrolase|uniref:carbon-nitrogen hydrolase family protein n=1 Tax=Kerstersia gyiorum TaxID=206506 RepID=UPI000FDBD998|nr:carbon-nitrogen hydrolase family protein [Kerstersia gyiorum]AZV92643.1 hydrolase [Bordetella sp. J329]MCH4270887.1 carbon-nitrogen hydrolase family protein [Kerstersia gyiorum]MCI1229419.1 carbon-nitrogen hydrolase family protein [Kerstersia gyiorum]
MTTRVALIQLDSGNDRAANLAEIERWVLAAAQDGAQLIITPEYSDARGDAALLQQQASPVPGIVTEHMASLARRTGCWIQLGSMHERLADDPRLGNTSLVFNPDGQIAASYRKTHLYDAVVNGMPYLESDDFAPGSALTTVEAAGLQLGLSICYDIRFAELFRALRSRGANVLVVPAAFNVHTGRDHWEVLLRARAIENQCYVLAAAQIGGPGPALPCLGRSMIIDPWGTVLACMPDQPGYICANLDPTRVTMLRDKLPAWSHRRGDLYPTSP